MESLRLLLVLILAVGSDPSFYVLTNDACQPCVNRYEKVREMYPRVVFVKYDVSDRFNERRFTAVLETLDDVLLTLPIFGVFSGSELRAVVAGEVSQESWDRILGENVKGVPVYVGDAVGYAELRTIVEDRERAERLRSLLLGGEVEGLTGGFGSLLMPVSLAAVMDAVNPCAISVFLVMLTFLFYGSSRGAVLGTGLAFSAAVFVTYLVMGLGALRVMTGFIQLRYVVSVITLLVGLFSVLEFLTGPVKRIPDNFADRIDRYVRAASGPKSGFAAGVVTTVFLLPCSSAPYFVALSLLSENATQLEGLMLLVVYNLIIVVPFLLITVGIRFLGFGILDLRLLVSEKKKWINLLVGVGLILLSLYSLKG